jgi:transposase
MADELMLSFVPSGEQRIWRSMTRRKLQLTRDRVRLQNQIECLREEMRIKLSIGVSHLLGASGLRLLHALASGETDPKKLAQRGGERLQVHRGATSGCVDGNSTAGAWGEVGLAARAAAVDRGANDWAP